MRLTVPIAVALVIVLSTGAWAATTHKIDGDLTCQVQVGLGDYYRPGSALPIVLEFENTGQPRVIAVRTGPRLVVNAVFSVPAGRGIRRCLYVPVSADWSYYGELASIELHDAESRRRLKRIQIADQVWRLNYAPDAGLSNLLTGISVSRAAAFAVNEDFDPRHTLKVDKVSTSALPDSWVGYSGLDVIVMDYGLWASTQLDRKPIIDWMAMGGICLIADAPPEAGSELKRLLSSEAPFFSVRFAGTARESFLVGMGGAALVDRGLLAGSQKGFFSTRGLRPGLLNASQHYDSPGYPRVPDVGEPPFWPVLFSLAAFAVLVGPLGWWYLVSRKKRALLYYFAAPAASLCAIVLAIVFSMLHEGFTPYLSCVALRLLDQRTGTLIELSQFGVYVPFRLGGSLRGSAEELPHFFSHGRQNRQGLTVTPSEGRCLYGAVLPAREKVWFGRELIRLERKRLLVWQEDGKIWVENHLGCALKDLIVSLDGNCAQFDSLRPGEKKAAPPLDPEGRAGLLSAARKRFTQTAGGSILRKAAGLCTEPRSGILEGANLYAAECVECTPEHVWLKSFSDKGTRSMIFGVF